MGKSWSRGRRWVGAGVRSAIAAIVLTSSAQAQDFPNRVVKVVNPYVAGSTTDRLARVLGIGMASRLGREFVVENRAGAGGAIGTLAVTRADPDGYTLLFAPALVLSVLRRRGTTPAMSRIAPADLPDFHERDGARGGPDSPFKTLGDLLPWRSQAWRPELRAPGPLTIPHLAMEEFLLAAKIDIKDIPFHSDPLVVADLLADADVDRWCWAPPPSKTCGRFGIFSETRHSSFQHPNGEGARLQRDPGELRRAVRTCRHSRRCGGELARRLRPTLRRMKIYVKAANAAAQPADTTPMPRRWANVLKRDIDNKSRVLARWS